MKRLCGALAVVCAATLSAAEKEPDKGKAVEPRALPDSTAKSWQDIGGRIGWIGPSVQYGQVYFDPNFDAKYMDLAHTVPGIIVAYGRADFAKLKTVTPPEVPFALVIHNYPLKDEDFQVLWRFKNLKILEITNLAPGQGFAEKGFRNIAKLDSVTRLKILDTKVGDAGMKELAGMNQLVSLDIDLRKAGVTSAGLKHLSGMKNLKELYLLFGELQDSDLKELASLGSLERLDLRRTNLTDEGLLLLTPMKSLKTLDVSFTKVTGKGAKAFEAALPTCKLSPASADFQPPPK
jgi:hypothetical protein